MKFDLGIIGAGPAGYVAAERAGHKGLKVVLFDKSYLGGVCLNEGCIPTKTLLFSTKIFDYAKNGKKYGVLAENVQCDFSALNARKNKVVKKLVAGVGSKMKKNKVEVVMERAFIESGTDDQIIIKAADQVYECRNLLIATGSEPVIPPIKGLNREKILTSKEILDLDKIPESLTIIGGGVIGMEFANIFSTLGTKVTVIEMLDEILTGMDVDSAVMLRQEFTKNGIEFHLKSRVVEINGKKVIYEFEGEKKEVDSEKILISVGRKPVTEGFGLENLNVELIGKGVKIDKNCRTNLPNVYAAGDVTGYSLLAHTASREAEVAVNNILGEKDTMRYNAIPAVVYTNPEVSGVGLTEAEAKKKKIDYEVKSLPMVYAGRFIVENEGKLGLCKILTGKKYGELLGVHMVGNPSSEMIFGAAMAIEAGLRVKDMKEVVFPHPTVSEIVKETLFEF